MAQDLQVSANNLKGLLEKAKKEIAAALPKHVTPDRMMRIALTEARKNPDLLECDQASFLGAVIQAAQLGLEPGGALGHCYLIPFNNSKKGIKEVQFMVGYRGMIDLVSRSEKVSHFSVRAVHDGDSFEYEFGLDEFIKHKPGGLGKLTHVYAIVHLKNGGKLFDVMTLAEVEAVKKTSKTAGWGPWKDHFEEMAKKSVIRRLFKVAPVSIEIQKAIGLDELADAGESQSNSSFLDGEAIETTGRPVNGGAEGLSALLAAQSSGVKTSPEFDKAVDSTPDPRSMIK